MKDYDVLNELVPKTQELHRAIFDKGYEQGQKEALEQQPCEDCISRQAVLDIIIPYCQDDDGSVGNTGDLRNALDDIESLPPVTPKKNTGEWMDDEFGSKCSCCDIHTDLDKFDRPMKFKYCSMCGAKMVESQESEDKE